LQLGRGCFRTAGHGRSLGLRFGRGGGAGHFFELQTVGCCVAGRRRNGSFGLPLRKQLERPALSTALRVSPGSSVRRCASSHFGLGAGRGGAGLGLQPGGGVGGSHGFGRV
jgi:hypothetical protein